MKIEVDIEIPTTPNFVRLKSGGVISIKKLSDSQIFLLAEEWTRKLVEKARS